MQILKKFTTYLKTHLTGVWEGWLLAIHIDTRAIEFNTGITSMFVGMMLSLPPQDMFVGWWPTEYWGWMYFIWGFFSSVFAVYGPFAPRKWTAIIGVYLWIVLLLWMFENTHTVDKVWIAAFPYFMMAGSSVFTFLGLWRYPSKWSYYYEPDRPNGH